MVVGIRCPRLLRVCRPRGAVCATSVADGRIGPEGRGREGVLETARRSVGWNVVTLGLRLVSLPHLTPCPMP